MSQENLLMMEELGDNQEPMDARNYEAKATLKEGRDVIIRGIRPDDKAMIEVAFQHLSPQSIYQRFFGIKTTLAESELKLFTEVDFEKTVALVVELEAGTQAAIIGGGRYIEYDGEDDTIRPAEIAFTVKDEFQGQGIGKLLMKHLTLIARITQFEAIVLAQNKGMLKVFASSGLPMETKGLGSEVGVMLSLV
jgi:GNAT superfamily N-acetyltransferase